MQLIHISLLFHFVGVGLLFTAIVAGWMLHARYMKAPDYKSKRAILAILRPIGLLSPISIGLLLATGTANMFIAHYDPVRTLWLSIKLVLFVVAAVTGIFFGARSSRRSKIVASLDEGTAPAGSEARVAAMDIQQRLFFIFQTAVVLVILGLSIVKPLG